MSDLLKRQAAERAVALVRNDMTLGLGTGSTAAWFVKFLGTKVREGLRVLCVPTSEATRIQAQLEGIPLATLEEIPQLDLTVDGADELDHSLRLIKGGGGALLREKIVAAASRRMIVIADETKLVETLGKFRLPIEVIPFGMAATQQAVEKLLGKLGMQGEITLRRAKDATFVTDGGHYILDADLGRIERPEDLASALNAVPGVVEHGLFLQIATGALVATQKGLVELGDLRP